MYVPGVDTVTDEVVAPLLHKSEPVKSEAVNNELPQLSTTVTVGVSGVVFGVATPLPSALVQPFTVCVTVYVPGADTVIADEVAALLHNREPVKPEAINKELSQLLVTATVGAAGIALGVAIPLPGELVHPFTD